LRLPLKTECALKFFTVLNIEYIQLMLALKTVALEFFTEMKYFFIIHDF